MTDYEEFGASPPKEPLPPRRRRTTRMASSSTPAGHGARFAAATIDIALWFGPSFGLGVLMGAGAVDARDDAFAVVGWGFLLVFVTQATLLTVRSQSVGKLLLGLRIVRHEDESKPGFARIVLVRMVVTGVLAVISNIVVPFFPILPYLWIDGLCVFRSDRRCLHDLMAETKVIAGKPGQFDLHAFD